MIMLIFLITLIILLMLIRGNQMNQRFRIRIALQQAQGKKDFVRI